MSEQHQRQGTLQSTGRGSSVKMAHGRSARRSTASSCGLLQWQLIEWSSPWSAMRPLRSPQYSCALTGAVPASAPEQRLKQGDSQVAACSGQIIGHPEAYRQYISHHHSQKLHKFAQHSSLLRDLMCSAELQRPSFQPAGQTAPTAGVGIDIIHE